MGTPKDLFQQQYEVVKTRTGAEVMGMTRDTDNGLVITLPMICSLQMVPGAKTSHCTFYPYLPLSSEETVTFPYDHIAHRSIVNEQFIPLYDNASATWFKMIEEKTIPLVTPNDLDSQADFEDRVAGAMQRILQKEDALFEEELALEELDDPDKIIH